MPAQTLLFQDFRGGLWAPQGAAAALPPSVLLQATNLEYWTVPGGGGERVGVRGRRGYLAWSTVGGQPRGLLRYYPASGTKGTLVPYQNGAVVNFLKDSNDDGTLESITGNFNATSGAHWRWINVPQQNKAYGVNGTANGIRSWDGTTLALVTPVGTAVNGPYLCTWHGAFWATKSDEIWQQIYSSNGVNIADWPGLRSFVVQDPRGSKITGLTPAPGGDLLLILKEDGIFRYQGDPDSVGGSGVSQVPGKGCSCPRTVTLTEFGVFYGRLDGLYLTDGSSTPAVEISRPIRPLWTQYVTKTNVADVVGLWDKHRRKYHVQLPGGPWLTAQAVDGAGWLWSTNTGIHDGGLAWEDASDGGRIFIATADARLFEIETGALDLTVPLTTTLQTAYTRLTPPLQTGRATRVWATYKGTAALTLRVSYDEAGSQVATLGQTGGAVQSARVFLDEVENIAGKRLALSLEGVAGGPAFELHELGVDVRVRSGRRFEG
jgi:hypothetical protein